MIGLTGRITFNGKYMKQMIISLILAAIIGGVAADTSEAKERSAPFYLVGKHQAVDVIINGKGPYKFLFDTGASDTSIDKALADELGLTVNGRSAIGDPQNPDAIPTELVEIPKLKIGEIEFSKAAAMSYDLSQIFPANTFRGVIGMPLFADSLLKINYPDSVISVKKGKLPVSNGKDVVGLAITGDGNFALKLVVAGRPINAVVDTGSSGGFTLPKKYAAVLPLDSPLAVVGMARTVNNKFSLYGTSLNGAIKLGGFEFDHPKITFNDLLPEATLGFEVLKRFELIIDQKNLRMRFVESNFK